MQTYRYTDARAGMSGPHWVDVLPDRLEEGITFAARQQCEVRIANWTAELFMPHNMENGAHIGIAPPAERVTLDLAALFAYPDIQKLGIYTDFCLDGVLNTDTLYRLPKLQQLTISGQTGRFALDLAKLPQLGSLSLDKYSPSIANIGQATGLHTLLLWAYPRADLTELANLHRLRDLRLYHAKIQSLDGLENLTALDYLDIAYAKNLRDISALDRLEQKHKTARVNLPKKFKRQ